MRIAIVAGVDAVQVPKPADRVLGLVARLVENAVGRRLDSSGNLGPHIDV